MASGRRRGAPLLLALAVCLLAYGCLYSSRGVRSHFDVVDDLYLGMSEQLCLEALADGGACGATTSHALRDGHPLPNGMHDAVRRALRRAERRVKRRAVRAVSADRQWGFTGYGVIWMFFDGSGGLIGHYVEHVN